MKFLLFALAVFGVAQAVEIQPKATLNEAFDQIRAAIPSERIVEIIQACADDPEVQQISQFLNTEFPAVVQFIREDAEIAGFFAELAAAGVTFDSMNALFERWGIAPIEFSSITLGAKTCGGWRGVYEQVQEEVTFTDLVIVISQVYDAYPEFAGVWDRISAAEPTFQRVLSDPLVASVFERLTGMGVDMQVVTDFVNGLFGWSF